MSEEIRTADEIITEYIFDKPPGELWVLVEGETDVAFLWEYRTDDKCELFDTHGKDELLCILKFPLIRDKPDIVGIVDADYWLLNEKKRIRMESLLYDENFPDLEILTLSSRALTKSLILDITRVSKSRISLSRIECFVRQLTAQAFRLGMESGYFRLLNDKEGYEISFRKFWDSHQLDQFYDPRTLTFDRRFFAIRLAEHHKSRWPSEPDRWIPPDELLYGVEALEKKHPIDDDDIRLCRGKDVVTLAEFIGPHLLESEFANDLSKEQLCQIDFDFLSTEIRKCYEYIYFLETSLYRRIRAWECQSGEFRIIRSIATA